jgi:predicted glutamine amidotransferase/transglutaminase-like putative cysteine protease
MPNVLAMSFEGALAPSVRLRCAETETPPPDGWGVAYYAREELAATILKDAAPAGLSALSAHAGPSEQVESSIFLLHMRTARWGSRESLADTQPFSRAYGGRDWVFAHGGSVHHKLEFAGDRHFIEPIGSTDSETIFCELLNRIADRRWRNLGYADFAVLRSWFLELNQYGELTAVLSDGRDVVVYADLQGELYQWDLDPPHEDLVFRDDALEIDLTRRGLKSRKGVLLASSLLETSAGVKAKPERVEPGSLLVLREGQVTLRANDGSAADDAVHRSSFIVRPRQVKRPTRAEPKVFDVLHETIYSYEKPVEHSAHMLRLTPIHGRLQNVVSHQIDISVDGRQRQYYDVFGNDVRKLVIESPYRELAIVARSRVEVLDVDPLAFRPLHARTNLPLVWMPWQAQILTPYLLPPELPETQLLELIDYAMSFVNRNDSDLLETLMDLNNSIFRDFEYVPGATTVFTSAYEVGYIYTGPKNQNQIQSEASHAWVEVYLPEVGWKGFDPTNGILTQTDHVRVAVGRNYLDATPTSGTIYVGGGPETLRARVVVEPAHAEGEAGDEEAEVVTLAAAVSPAADVAANTEQVQQQAQQQGAPDDDPEA